jgi:DMSO/TMAO reductase YedYZ molybdopterin-dependent catalytic subunit
MKSVPVAMMIVALLVAAMAPACSPPARSQDVKSVEVREYKGEKLDPIRNFEENSIKGPQRVDISSYRLKVGGLVAKPLTLAYDAVLARPVFSKVTIIHCVEGWDVKVLWEGVALTALIDEAEARPAANTVIFRSADGYSTSLPLEYIRRKDILLAHKMNGLTLPAERGYPFLVVAEDKWGYKWAKWVTAIELTSDPNYRGYWESRGYSNNGDHSGPIFEKRR